jgi:dTDP-4-dehydrorhamnose reductase
MKILITGANGSIGNYMSKYFASRHEVLPLVKSKLDITNKVQCIEVLRNAKPDSGR